MTALGVMAAVAAVPATLWVGYLLWGKGAWISLEVLPSTNGPSVGRELSLTKKTRLILCIWTQEHEWIVTAVENHRVFAGRRPKRQSRRAFHPRFVPGLI